MNKPLLPNQSETLSIQHREELGSSLTSLGHGLSEYCFSNLYLFRKTHQYQLIKDQYPFIKGRTYDGASFLMPIFDLADISDNFLADIIEVFDCFFPIHENDLRYFPQDQFSFESNRDDADYLFSAEKLKTYGGRRLSSKRNLMKQFESNHFHRFEKLDGKTRDDAQEVLERWLLDVGKPIEDTDFYPCLEALQHWETLDLFGFIYYSKEEPCGFVLGKEIIPKTCVFHFAKGRRKFNGVFQFMFNHVAKLLNQRFLFYNFEQDMGKPNFRKTKLSYCPDMLLNKYRVRLKTE